MTAVRVSPGKIQGDIVIPPSKSQCLRAILFGTLAEGTTTVLHPLPSPDTEAMIEGCRLLGATITASPGQIIIEGVGGKISHAEDVVNVGNSGLCLRLLTAVAALGDRPVIITGDTSVRHRRPMTPMLNGLKQLGAQATSTRGDGFAPVIVQGPLRGGTAVINGQDSQPVSALLIAGALAPAPIDIIVEEAGEKPWIDLTLHWLQRLGIEVVREGYDRYSMKGRGRIPGFTYTVPGDWSSASFPIAAALVTGSEILLHNVDVGDPQGDKALIHVFGLMGAKMTVDEEKRTLYVHPGSTLRGVTVDINDFVDGICILAVVACYAEGDTHITNAAIARHKESDRIGLLAAELRKMGALVEERPDGLNIIGSVLHGRRVASHSDHRMAMALMVAALAARGDSHVDGVQCVAKTYPSFVQELQRLGGNVEVLP